MTKFTRSVIFLLCCGGTAQAVAQPPESPPESPSDVTHVLRLQNLVAWCIVPFDAARRGPAERAAMLQELGITRCAYDWRAEHVATFEQEILEYRKHGIEFFAFWDTHEAAFQLFEKYQLQPQIWQTLNDPGGDDQASRVEAAAQQRLPLAERTRTMGCQLSLYNHGGWGGEPENLVAVCRRLHELGHDHVGIVYNFHHGHGHIDDWAESLRIMRPYLHCLNLNGMNAGAQPKILGIGKGVYEQDMIREIVSSQYRGPIGILDHRSELDARDSLRENRDGLEWVRREFEKPGSGGPRPVDQPLTKAMSSLQRGYVLPAGTADVRRPPITVEVRCTLNRRDQYNILVASDTKSSPDHWELFSMNGSGQLTAYLPGQQPDHVHSDAMICDGQPHTLTMIYAADRVQLYVDSKKVAEQPIQSRADKSRVPPTDVPGALAIGRLVEGGLDCSGTMDWVRISRGVREVPEQPLVSVSRDDATIALWKPAALQSPQEHSAHNSMPGPFPEQSYDAERVARLVADSQQHGDAARGAVVFSQARLACLSCHKIGRHGGTLGPDLSAVAKDRPLTHIVESVLWPQRDVQPEFMTWTILTANGKVTTGYKVSATDQQLTLRDPASGKLTAIPREDIEEEVAGSTVMPAGLTAAMPRPQQLDLIRFLSDLGRAGQPLSAELQHVIAHAQMQGPAEFEWTAAPLQPRLWPHASQAVNRDRVYEFYTKQAEYFRQQPHVPMLLAASPGLDGGQQGHWGNQNDQTWASAAWNRTDLGIVQAGVFRDDGLTVPRAVCVRLGDGAAADGAAADSAGADGAGADSAGAEANTGRISVCFNPDTLTYDAVWADGFVTFSSFRHGFLDGLHRQGTPRALPEWPAPEQPFHYQGYYRQGNRIVFAYRIGDVDYLDAPWVADGQLVRELAPVAQHSLRGVVTGGPLQWPRILETEILPGDARPFAVDTIELPTDNPWQALLFCSGHDFLPDGSALVCTMQGDVWHVSGLDSGIGARGRSLETFRRRSASGSGTGGGG